MSNPIEVRPFDDADLPEVLEVLRLSLGEPPGLARTKALFAWKHFDNPFGRSLMLVAEATGRIAGFRAFMRWDLVMPDGTTLRCVRAVDTATHPDFQRRGIFRLLTLAGIELAADQHMDLIFNTPNEKSGAGYLTMGWRRIGTVGVMVRPGVGVLRPRHQHAAATSAAERSMATPDRTTAFADRVPVGLRTPRTAQYLRWRFESHPTARYLLATSEDGVAIGRAHDRRGRRELVISDLAGARSHTAARLLRATARPDYTVAWFSPGAVERRWALRSGMVPLPGFKAMTLMARPLNDLSIDLTWSKWDLSLGDLELL
ncbi:MAG TPA: GNAT family N-acetyltransferase [Acidimicrobiia bacterium]|nr:GNAT family N-acetyltransferase [Acidimicrobiia bacterium]